MSLQAAISSSIPDSVDIFNQNIFPGARRDGGAEPQSLASVSNIPGLNTEFLRST